MNLLIVDLRINTRKSEVMILNICNSPSVLLDGQALPQTVTFTYLGSTVRVEGATGTDIKQQLSKERAAFNNLQNVWKSGQYTTRIKLKLYNSCVIPTLLYGSECWRMTEADQQKLSIFHTKSLRRILRIFWPNKISNQDLLSRCNQGNMNTIIERRRWRWIGHVLRKDQQYPTKTALLWTPKGEGGDGLDMS